jgi:hypothetical protein
VVVVVLGGSGVVVTEVVVVVVVVVVVLGGSGVVVTEVGGAVVVVVVFFGGTVVVVVVVFAVITVVVGSTPSVGNERAVSWLTPAVTGTVAVSSLFAPQPAINEPVTVMATTKVNLFLEILTMVLLSNRWIQCITAP